MSNSLNSTLEVVPWGVKAVWQGEDILQRGNFASDSYAFVIDSGVSNATGDINLASNSSWHRSWVDGESAFSDTNGHGTHIAGTIGALVNGKGIVGVAPGCQIVSLKVYGSSLSGPGSTVIEAINHAVTVINNNNLDKNKAVINLSLGGTFDPKMNEAIKNAADQGIKFSIAAGNYGKDVDNFSPSCMGDHPNVYVISAVDNNYQMPFWSNWDRLDANDQIDDVDFAAPGVDILSYYRNGQLTSLSGTSQAAPHVAGLLVTGGVQAGRSATSSNAGTSDPVAMTSTKIFDPSTVTQSFSWTPTPPPSPTYSLKVSNTINEGQKFRVDISTTGVPQGRDLYWEISGKGITLDDFRRTDNNNKISHMWGNPRVDANGTTFVEFNVWSDNITEGDEVIKFELYNRAHPSVRQKVCEALVTVQDTSKAPVVIPGLDIIGTRGNDTLVGTIGNDKISGVSPTGTDLTSLGRGQIDTLTGGLGRDTFILGDSRGAFYDDGIRNNTGLNDYAFITDFKPGEDKIQCKKGIPIRSSFSNGNLSLYLDLNRNGTLETSGPNRDDLFAVLQGVTSIGNSDLLVVS